MPCHSFLDIFLSRTNLITIHKLFWQTLFVHSERKNHNPLCQIVTLPFLSFLMPSCGLAFSKKEIDFFLDLMEEILPILSMEWEDIKRRCSKKYGSNNPTKEMLKRKFQNHSTIRPEIQWVEEILNDIKQQANIYNIWTQQTTTRIICKQFRTQSHNNL